MSEPEIARRCLSCGASVRGRASFCPQCGSRMDGVGAAGSDEKHAARQNDVRPQQQQTTQKSTLVEEAERVAATLNDKLPPLSANEQAASGNHRPAPERAGDGQAARGDAGVGARSPQTLRGEDEGGAAVAEQTGGATAAAAAAKQTEARGRMRQRAASVGENLRPRVEKLREASTVVFDEASDDPGLRFVIVATVLFIIFLLVFILNYILG